MDMKLKESDIYLMPLSDVEYLCQRGHLTLSDVFNRMMFENDPYPVLFKELPFNEALDVAFKLAGESVDRAINWNFTWHNFKRDMFLPIDTASHGYEFKNSPIKP